MLKWIDVLKRCRDGNPVLSNRVTKTAEQWKSILSVEEFRVTRLKGTERAFSSDMCTAFEDGIYACRCCGTELFESTEKFDSGTGWPSFTSALQDDLVAYEMDTSHGMRRVEILCNRCDAHLGHVFPDGPAPSGLRFCVNAISLKKKED